MNQNAPLTTPDATPTTDEMDLAGIDRVALEHLDLDTISVGDLAAWLATNGPAHGPAHLSAIERIELAERLTRRRFIIGAGGMLGAAALGACGAGEQAADPTVTTAATRTITDAAGNTYVIPANPQRVVVLDPITLENALALDAPIVAAPNMEGLGAFYEAMFPEGADNIGDFGEPNLEVLTAAAPDLILGDPRRVEDFLDEITAIAPFAPNGVAAEGEGPTWQNTYFRPVAEALGRQEQAENVIADYQTRVAAIRTALGGAEAVAGITAILVRLRDPAQVGVYTPLTYYGHMLYDDLGFSLPPTISALYEEEGGLFLRFSIERLDVIDADAVFAYSFGEGELEQSQPVRNSPLWQQMEAVQDGRVYEVGDYWWGAGPLSVDRMLDDIERYVVDEDGA